MSFVIPTAVHCEPPFSSNPGPGQYNTITTHNLQPSVAPFNSTGSRQPKKHKDYVEPGPGAYQVDYHKPVPTIQSSFKSKCGRFEGGAYDTEPTPGPGDYNPLHQAKRARSKSSKADRENPVMRMIIKENQSRRSESIKKPSHYVRVIFRNPRNINSYISQFVDSEFILNRQIGPGEYEPLRDAKSSGAVCWSKSKVKRFKEEKDESLGPGTYQVEEHKQFNKESAVFRSQDARSHFDRVKYKSSNQPYISLMNRLDIKDSTPGPGQYEAPQAFINRQSCIQSFGTQSYRFKYVQSTEVVGPGSYNLNVKVPKGEPIMSKIAKRYRCKSQIYNKEEQPKPHAYDASNNTMHQKMYHKFKDGYNGNFGSKEERFRAADTTGPGPGNYSLERKHKQTSTTSYMANSKRVDSSNLAAEETPFLNYNANIYDISKNVERKKELIKNLELVDVKRPPFESSVQRFKESVEPENPPPTGAEVVRRERPPRPSAVFNSRSQRNGLKPWNSETPPPGFYHRASKLQKCSFNSKYGFRDK